MADRILAEIEVSNRLSSPRSRCRWRSDLERCTMRCSGASLARDSEQPADRHAPDRLRAAGAKSDTARQHQVRAIEMVYEPEGKTALAVVSRAAEADKGAPLVRDNGAAERRCRRDT